MSQDDKDRIPPFDASGEDVALRHEIRREVIAENVDQLRKDREDLLVERVNLTEEQRVARAEALAEESQARWLEAAEDRKKLREQALQRADEVELLALRRVRFVAWLAAAAALVAVAVACVAIINSGRIDRNSVQAERISFEAIRGCIRQNLNSAIVVSSAPENSRLELASTLYPIIDCKNAVVNGNYVELSNVESDKYVSLVLKGRAPIINNGKVVGSRARVLEGLEKVDKIGTPNPK